MVRVGDVRVGDGEGTIHLPYVYAESPVGRLP